MTQKKKKTNKFSLAVDHKDIICVCVIVSVIFYRVGTKLWVYLYFLFLSELNTFQTHNLYRKKKRKFAVETLLSEQIDFEKPPC